MGLTPVRKSRGRRVGNLYSLAGIYTQYGALLSSMYGIASMRGPLIGGASADHRTWHLCFYMNLPLGDVVLLEITSFSTRVAGHPAAVSLPRG